MASLQKKGDSYYCQFCYHGKRYTFTVGAVSEEEAGNKSRQVDYLLMRLKQRLIVLPDGVDIVTFVEHDGKPPSVAHRWHRLPHEKPEHLAIQHAKQIEGINPPLIGDEHKRPGMAEILLRSIHREITA